MAARVIGPEQKAEIIRLNQEGLSQAKIAAIMGVSQQRIWANLRGVKKRVCRTGLPAIKLPVAEIAELYRQGALQSELAARFRVSRQVISDRLQRAGVRMRGKHVSGGHRTTAVRCAKASADTAAVIAAHLRDFPSEREVAIRAMRERWGADATAIAKRVGAMLSEAA